MRTDDERYEYDDIYEDEVNEKAQQQFEKEQRLIDELEFVPEDALREALLNALCHKQPTPSIPTIL